MKLCDRVPLPEPRPWPLLLLKDWVGCTEGLLVAVRSLVAVDDRVAVSVKDPVNEGLRVRVASLDTVADLLKLKDAECDAVASEWVSCAVRDAESDGVWDAEGAGVAEADGVSDRVGSALHDAEVDADAEKDSVCSADGVRDNVKVAVGSVVDDSDTDSDMLIEGDITAATVAESAIVRDSEAEMDGADAVAVREADRSFDRERVLDGVAEAVADADRVCELSNDSVHESVTVTLADSVGVPSDQERLVVVDSVSVRDFTPVMETDWLEVTPSDAEKVGDRVLRLRTSVPDAVNDRVTDRDAESDGPCVTEADGDTVVDAVRWLDRLAVMLASRLSDWELLHVSFFFTAGKAQTTVSTGCSATASSHWPDGSSMRSTTSSARPPKPALKLQ